MISGIFFKQIPWASAVTLLVGVWSQHESCLLSPPPAPLFCVGSFEHSLSYVLATHTQLTATTNNPRYNNALLLLVTTTCKQDEGKNLSCYTLLFVLFLFLSLVAAIHYNIHSCGDELRKRNNASTTTLDSVTSKIDLCTAARTRMIRNCRVVPLQHLPNVNLSWHVLARP